VSTYQESDHHAGLRYHDSCLGLLWWGWSTALLRYGKGAFSSMVVHILVWLYNVYDLPTVRVTSVSLDHQALGIRRIVVSRFSGVLSAYGIHLADIVVEKQEPSAIIYSPETLPVLLKKLEKLEAVGRQELLEQGFAPSAIASERFLNLRYAGTDCALMTSVRNIPDAKSSDYSKVRQDLDICLLRPSDMFSNRL